VKLSMGDCPGCEHQDSIFSPEMLVGTRCGFEALPDLEVAHSHLKQLASASPGEYFVFDLRARQVLVSLISADEEVCADSRTDSNRA
jgi:hypothetical protein